MLALQDDEPTDVHRSNAERHSQYTRIFWKRLTGDMASDGKMTAKEEGWESKMTLQGIPSSEEPFVPPTCGSLASVGVPFPAGRDRRRPYIQSD